MHMFRNVVLAGLAAMVLQMNGLASGVAHFVFEVFLRLGELSHTAVVRVGDFRVPGVNLRAAPTTSAVVLGLGNPGDRVAVRHKLHGERVTCPDGSPNDIWWRVLDRRTRVSGYVSACYLR